VHSYDSIDGTNEVLLVGKTILVIKNVPNQFGRLDIL
jgi:hypothetical protein